MCNKIWYWWPTSKYKGNEFLSNSLNCPECWNAEIPWSWLLKILVVIELFPVDKVLHVLRECSIFIQGGEENYIPRSLTDKIYIPSLFDKKKLYSHPEQYSLFQKKRNISEVAFLLEKSVYEWIWGYASFWHDPRLHDPDPGPQEKSTEKSCVSFGKDCKNIW